MHRASRYRLYPNQMQERQFIQLCGAGRFVYNELLAEQKREYAHFEAGERDRPGTSPFEFGRRFVKLKERQGHEWLRELSCSIVRSSGAFTLGTAFAHYFRRIQEGKRGKEAGFPRFKVKGVSRESFTIPENVKVQNKRLWVPKIGWVRMNRKAASRTRGTDPWDGGKAKVAVVYRELDKWYVSVLWEVEDPNWHWHGGVCGVDRNSENLAADWIGGRKLIEIPYERVEKYEARARHYQWRASCREQIELKGANGEPVYTKSGKPVKVASNRRQRLQQRAAKAKRKAAEIRKNFSHQSSADLARLFGHIVLEELDVQAMRRSARGTKGKPGRGVRAKAALNRKMAQFSCMGMVDRFLQYKAWDLIRVPARNTSRTCAECGHVDEDNRKEQVRFKCLACGHTDNADLNAARNILDLGLNRLLAGGAPVTGRGEDNEAGAFFMECLVETVNDPSTMQWNYRDRPEFHKL
ncbi:MAG: transposase [Gammaproteobacteria bacterium]|nr:transposase [Gammaproteobacteria bacterium]